MDAVARSVRDRRRWPTFFLCVATLAVACKQEKPAGADRVALAPVSGDDDKAVADDAADEAPLDRGDAVLRFEPAKKTLYEGVHDKLRSSPTLGDLLGDVNAHFAWPREVVVLFRDCGEINAFYEPDPPSVVVCHELVDHLVDVFDPHIQDQDRSDQMAIGATAFILLHELGHALIDAHEVPVTGRVEDAVDQLATWLLMTRPRGGGELALDAAAWFALAPLEERAGEMLWDEHSLDVQRFYNIVCWVYGSNPEPYGYLVKNGRLPKKRARHCVEEYQDFASSFEVLLRDAQLEQGGQ